MTRSLARLGARRNRLDGKANQVELPPPLADVRDASGGPDRGIAEGAPRAPLLRRDAILRRTLAASDVISAGTAVTLCVVVAGDDRLAPAAPLVLPLVVLVSKMIGLYDRDQYVLHKSTLEEAPAIFQVSTLYALVLWLSQGLFVIGYFGRTQLLTLWAALFVFMLLGRAAARRIVQARIPRERCLVIGDAVAAKAIERKFRHSHSVSATVVGRVPLTGQDRVNGAAPPILGDFGSLARLLREHQIHRVVIAPDVSNTDEVLGLIRQVKLLGVKVSVLPRLFEVVGYSVEVDNIDGLALMGIHRYGLTKSSEILKRGMDVVVSVLGLIFFSPLIAGIAAMIRLDSPGPAFFTQPRIGRGGKEFRVIKFRTMVDGADGLKAELSALNEADGLFKIADDPRITKMGRWLRRTSLDELPQLVNVLRGEMSLVGPRPLVADEDRRIEGWERNRLLFKPGMTGHWQIFGSARIPLREMVKIDYLYGANWSPWLDTKILIRTVPHVFRRSGL
jgi:exopolysaccharide biosynthesis polyprenyl glycosylphosphotransferase